MSLVSGSIRKCILRRDACWNIDFGLTGSIYHSDLVFPRALRKVVEGLQKEKRRILHISTSTGYEDAG
jgi:hypothetical protein